MGSGTGVVSESGAGVSGAQVVPGDLPGHDRGHRPALEDPPREGAVPSEALELLRVDLAFSPEVQEGHVPRGPGGEGAAGEVQQLQADIQKDLNLLKAAKKAVTTG